MAMPGICHLLCIRVLEDSKQSGIFVINVLCGEPLLLQFWSTKPHFQSDELLQTGLSYRSPTEVEFALRVVRRASGLPNSHYWGPFVLALSLDALQFGFRLPAGVECGADMQDIMKQCDGLVLLR